MPVISRPPLRRFFSCKVSALALVILLGLSRAAPSQATEGFDFADVVEKYQKAVDEHPASIEAYMNLGFAYLAVDAMEQAKEMFHEVLRLDAESPEGHYWLGRSNNLQGNFEKSIPSFQMAVRLLPNWSDAYSELGLSYYRTYKYDEAEAAFKKALSLMAMSKTHPPRFAPPPIFEKENQEWINKVAPMLKSGIVYYLSLIAFERRLFDETAEYCRQVIRIEPQFAEAYFQLGMVHVQKKEWEAAEKAFGQAIHIRPQMGHAHYQLGLLYFRQGKQAEAAKAIAQSQQLNKSLEQLRKQQLSLMLNTDKAPVLSNLGWQYLNEKNYEAAVREYKKALWHSPNLAEAHNGIGYAYTMQDQLDKAIQAQQIAIQLKPQMAEAYAGMGLIRLKRAEVSQSEGDYELALSAYRKAIELNPDFPEALLNLGNIANKLSRLEEAEKAYMSLLTLRSNHAHSQLGKIPISRLHLNLGKIYMRQEKFPQANRHYREALKHNPDLAEAFYDLGFIAFKNGRADDAVDNYKSALKIQPDMAEAHYFLGKIYVEQNHFDPAEKAFQRVIEIQPSFHKAYERLAHLYGKTGSQINKAVALAERAVELQPNSAVYLNTLSWLYYINKDYVQAESAIKKALVLQPDNRLYQRGLKAVQQAMRVDGSARN
ncbi:MAG: tetratricopeptide repeat protein [Candidatus Poribacteria bacterium]|nr:tetratricopeptide repeat protein [Candidatus Poribacteria bacterium]